MTRELDYDRVPTASEREAGRFGVRLCRETLARARRPAPRPTSIPAAPQTDDDEVIETEEF